MWMLPTMGDVRRWLDLCLAIGYYFVFVFTMKRKCAAECDCMKATTASREFLTSHNDDDKMYGLHVDPNLNRMYRTVAYW